VALLRPAAQPHLDPLQAVLMHLPNGAYGTYQGLCRLLYLDPCVPSAVLEGLRYLSAVGNGCEYCQTVRGRSEAGEPLLDPRFYDVTASPEERDWSAYVGEPWPVVFEMATEVLRDRVVSASTGERLHALLTEAQIALCLFYFELVGASHRFSRAAGIEAACALPVDGSL
jgi:hypothetical protein